MFQSEPRDVRAEQMTDGHRAKMFIAFRVKRDIRENPHPQPQLDVSLDHVGIDGFQHDVRRQVAQRERLVDLRAAGERVVVGDERVLGDIVERKQFAFEKRMVRAIFRAMEISGVPRLTL